MVLDHFPRGKLTNMLVNYFEGFDEGIIGREAELKGYMVKFGERPLEGGERICEISMRLPMNNGAI